MAIILLGLVSSMAAIRVTCLETGETFDSMVIAARRFGVSSSLVAYHIQGKIRSVRGYHFTKEALLQPTVLRLRVDHAVQITAMCMESEPRSRHQLFLWMQKKPGGIFSTRQNWSTVWYHYRRRWLLYSATERCGHETTRRAVGCSAVGWLCQAVDL